MHLSANGGREEKKNKAAQDYAIISFCKKINREQKALALAGENNYTCSSRVPCKWNFVQFVNAPPQRQKKPQGEEEITFFFSVQHYLN